LSVQKLNFISNNKTKNKKPLNFCKVRETFNRVKRQPREWEEVFATFSSDRGLTSRIHTNSKKLNNQVIQFLKWANDSNKHFSKEEI
jgi:hypothetical protein